MYSKIVDILMTFCRLERSNIKFVDFLPEHITIVV